jgi:hypothetical protein
VTVTESRFPTSRLANLVALAMPERRNRLITKLSCIRILLHSRRPSKVATQGKDSVTGNEEPPIFCNFETHQPSITDNRQALIIKA